MTAYAPLAEHYEAWAAEMTEDIPFYVELAREADGPVVELAVGTGRVAVPVAREFDRRPFDDDAREFVFVTRRGA